MVKLTRTLGRVCPTTSPTIASIPLKLKTSTSPANGPEGRIAQTVRSATNASKTRELAMANDLARRVDSIKACVGTKTAATKALIPPQYRDLPDKATVLDQKDLNPCQFCYETKRHCAPSQKDPSRCESCVKNRIRTKCTLDYDPSEVQTKYERISGGCKTCVRKGRLCDMKTPCSYCIDKGLQLSCAPRAPYKPDKVKWTDERRCGTCISRRSGCNGERPCEYLH